MDYVVDLDPTHNVIRLTVTGRVVTFHSEELTWLSLVAASAALCLCGSILGLSGSSNLRRQRGR
jgi:hypothetical protein